ncbi:MAG: hypothetical protein Q9216_005355 [Gyalolechia sp. 2 TL-2023]
MSSNALHTSLLRPPMLHILRAAGYHATRPDVLDTVVDLAARYLSMLASKAAAHGQQNHSDSALTVADVRMALEDVGALRPQISAMEERIRGQEDLRGIEAFLNWMRGDEHREIRKIAGLVENEAPLPGLDIPSVKEDFLTGMLFHRLQNPPPLIYFDIALKKKHNKTGESSRFQGTVLGTFAEEKPVWIEGGPSGSLQDWAAQLNRQYPEADPSDSRQPSSALTSTYSSPLTDI